MKLYTWDDLERDLEEYAAWLGASEDVNRIRNFVFWKDTVSRSTGEKSGFYGKHNHTGGNVDIGFYHSRNAMERII